MTAANLATANDSSITRILLRRRGTVFAFAILGLIVGGVYLLLTQREYQVSSKLIVKQSGAQPGDASQPASNSAVGRTNELFHATQAQIMRSTPVLALAASVPGSNDWQTFRGVKNKSSYLKDHLEVTAGKQDETITLSLRTPYPEEGVKLLTSVTEAYEARQNKERKDDFQALREAFADEQSRLRIEMTGIEAQMAEFRAQNPTAATEDAASAAANRRLDSLSDALTKAELESINRKTDFTAAASAIGITDPATVDPHIPAGVISESDIAVLKAEATEAQRKLTSLKRTYLPSHPAIRQTQDRLNELNLQFVGAMKQRWANASKQEEEIRKSLTIETAAASSQRLQVNQLRELERKKERITATLGELDRKVKDISLTVDAGLITTQVLDAAAVDEGNFSPKASSVLPITGILGLLVGGVFALLKENLDPRLVSPGGARAALGLPVIGAIPTAAGGRSLESFGWIVHADGGTPAAEAFRAARTSLQFSVSETATKRVLVASPEQMAGKSTVASNLAIALAKSGKNVLLIDANLRDPVQHRIFGVSDAVGLVDLLSSSEANDRAIRRTTIEHLHVMPAGEVPANASELLNTSMFTDVLESLSSRYDVLLIDSPAIDAADDARIIAAACEGAILVIRSGASNRRSAAAARDGLLSVGCRVLGIIVNGHHASGGQYSLPSRPSTSDKYSNDKMLDSESSISSSDR
ncbi:MAG TPA: polysaccharide biosynthesis tyrosine autokinase [Tepidisphaeraceae bacterium]|nr:polysaccharide biosynthesis tyrosine autokinase [Tepidisphaeraceae bacterium]